VAAVLVKADAPELRLYIARAGDLQLTEFGDGHWGATSYVTGQGTNRGWVGVGADAVARDAAGRVAGPVMRLNTSTSRGERRA
jgi:hypothetical protein